MRAWRPHPPRGHSPGSLSRTTCAQPKTWISCSARSRRQADASCARRGRRTGAATPDTSRIPMGFSGRWPGTRTSPMSSTGEAGAKGRSSMTRFERGFEVVLWNSRLLILIAVVASLAVALAMFYVTTVDIVSLIPHLSHYHDLSLSADARVQLRGTIVAHVVEVVDGYLLAAIMLIFAL